MISFFRPFLFFGRKSSRLFAEVFFTYLYGSILPCFPFVAPLTTHCVIRQQWTAVGFRFADVSNTSMTKDAADRSRQTAGGGVDARRKMRAVYAAAQMRSFITHYG